MMKIYLALIELAIVVLTIFAVIIGGGIMFFKLFGWIIQ